MARKTPPPAPGSLTDEMREVIREGRELLKDFAAERKKMESLLAKGADAWVAEAVKKELDDIGPAIKRHMDLSIQKVYKTFDDLEATLLGTTAEARRMGEKSIPFMIDQLARRRRWLEKVWEAQNKPELYPEAMRILSEETDCKLDMDGCCEEHAWYAREDDGEPQECPIAVAKDMRRLGILDDPDKEQVRSWVEFYRDLPGNQG